MPTGNNHKFHKHTVLCAILFNYVQLCQDERKKTPDGYAIKNFINKPHNPLKKFIIQKVRLSLAVIMN